MWFDATMGIDMASFVLAALLSVPLVVLAVEAIAALLTHPTPAAKETGLAPSATRQALGNPRSPRVDVLIPAHNEADGIAATLQSIMPQLGPSDRLWVVADNCSDTTAAVARSHGARVLQRRDLDHRGKSFALQFGLQEIAADPPDVVLLVDADCRVQPRAVELLSALAARTGLPVQSAYLMLAPADPKPSDLISQAAVTLKNFIRPLGLQRFGMPCLLTGSGMAFPWSVVSGASLANGSIVEDLHLTVDLLLSGTPPLMCPNAWVLAELPAQGASADSQRKRWEHGHLHVLLTQAPRLIVGAVRQMRLDLLVMALEVLVPPLSLLALLLTAGEVLLVGGALLGASYLPAALLAGIGILAISSVIAALSRYTPNGICWTALLRIPLYVLHKLPLYVSFLFSRQREWVRTCASHWRVPVSVPENRRLDTAQLSR